MLQYQVNPQVGSLEVLYYIFDYLKIDMKMVRIGYDLIDPNIDLSVFNNNVYWKEFHRNIEEELLPKMQDPRGMDLSIY